jgi:hypothetical protein
MNMIEQHKASHEQHEKTLDDKESLERQNELLKNSREKAENSKHDHVENLHKIRDQIEKEATSAKEMTKSEIKTEGEPDAGNTYWYSKEYRELAFKQLMSKVQGHLSAPEKLASRVLHQPTIEKAAEVGSKTIARPSGVLMGSIFSFVTSLATYYFAKQNGYDMTYGIFLASFVGGFLLGVAIEFSYRGIRSLIARD